MSIYLHQLERISGQLRAARVQCWNLRVWGHLPLKEPVLLLFHCI